MTDEILRRYTDIPALLHLLKTKKITLLDPGTWDDKNDAFYMDTYKGKKGVKRCLALCFTEASETYHHWKVFGGGGSGVCIVFDKSSLLDGLKSKNEQQMEDVTHGRVQYKIVKNNNAPRISELPFLKRWAFRDEAEYRIIYHGKDDSSPYKNFRIDISCVVQIILSPWMPAAIVGSIRKIIESIDGCLGISVKHSKLIEFKKWLKKAEEAT